MASARRPSARPRDLHGEPGGGEGDAHVGKADAVGVEAGVDEKRRFPARLGKAQAIEGVGQMVAQIDAMRGDAARLQDPAQFAQGRVELVLAHMFQHRLGPREIDRGVGNAGQRRESAGQIGGPASPQHVFEVARRPEVRGRPALGGQERRHVPVGCGVLDGERPGIDQPRPLGAQPPRDDRAEQRIAGTELEHGHPGERRAQAGETEMAGDHREGVIRALHGAVAEHAQPVPQAVRQGQARPCHLEADLQPPGHAATQAHRTRPAAASRRS